MGIFDKVNSDSDRTRDEVEISMAEEKSSPAFSASESSDRSRSSSSSGSLRNEVETRLTDKASTEGTESSVNLDDIHEQNKKIIRLLETLTDDPKSNDENENDTGMAGGLDGVL